MKKPFNWSSEKNETLKKERDISFEIVVEKLLNGEILSDAPHPNSEKYPNQKIFLIEILNYCFLIPYVENDSEIFLKTIIPSRKKTKEFLKEVK